MKNAGNEMSNKQGIVEMKVRDSGWFGVGMLNRRCREVDGFQILVRSGQLTETLQKDIWWCHALNPLKNPH